MATLPSMASGFQKNQKQTYLSLYLYGKYYNKPGLL